MNLNQATDTGHIEPGANYTRSVNPDYERLQLCMRYVVTCSADMLMCGFEISNMQTLNHISSTSRNRYSCRLNAGTHTLIHTTLVLLYLYTIQLPFISDSKLISGCVDCMR